MSRRTRRASKQPAAAPSPGVLDGPQSVAAVRFASSGFEGANFSTRRGYIYFPTLETRREVDSYSRLELIRRARWLKRNTGFAKRCINAISNMVGFLTPRPLTSDREWNAAAEKLWRTRACSATTFDLSRRFNANSYQPLLTRTRLLDGDVLSVFTQGAAHTSPALRCDLQRIATALAEQGIETDWPALLEALCGPVPEELRANRANQRAWDDFWPWAAEHVAKQQFPCAADWLKSLRADGSLIRLSKGDAAIATERVRRACAVLTQLPLMNEPLPGAAARLCGNSHALDPDSPLATLILRSLAMQRATSVPDRSDDRRQLWSTSASFATTSVPRSRNRISP